MLVHRRADADKPKDEAELHRVRSMLAAGWGGTGSVVCESSVRTVQFSRAPTVMRSMRSSASAAVDRLAAPDVTPANLPCGRHRAGAEATSPPTLRDIADQVVRHLAEGAPISDLPEALATMDLHPALVTALAELRVMVTDEPLVWLIVALWVSQRNGIDGNLHHASILARHAGPIYPSVRARAIELLDRRLGGYASDSGEGSRMRRLLAKMAPN